MIPSHALHAMDRCLQDITQDSHPFGGKAMLLGGDFRQVLPVVPRAPPAVVIDTCLKRSPMWPLFKQHRLTRNMRALPGESEFAAWLLQLGNGTLNNTTVEPGTVEIPPACVCEGDLVDEVFSAADSDQLHNRVILSPKNEHCLQVNERVLGTLPGEARVYLSADAVKCDDEDARQNYPVEFLNSLTPSGMPPHRAQPQGRCSCDATQESLTEARAMQWDAAEGSLTCTTIVFRPAFSLELTMGTRSSFPGSSWHPVTPTCHLC